MLAAVEAIFAETLSADCRPAAEILSAQNRFVVQPAAVGIRRADRKGKQALTKNRNMKIWKRKKRCKMCGAKPPPGASICEQCRRKRKASRDAAHFKETLTFRDNHLSVVEAYASNLRKAVASLLAQKGKGKLK